MNDMVQRPEKTSNSGTDGQLKHDQRMHTPYIVRTYPYTGLGLSLSRDLHWVPIPFLSDSGQHKLMIFLHIIA